MMKNKMLMITTTTRITIQNNDDADYDDNNDSDADHDDHDDRLYDHDDHDHDDDENHGRIGEKGAGMSSSW